MYALFDMIKLAAKKSATGRICFRIMSLSTFPCFVAAAVAVVRRSGRSNGQAIGRGERIATTKTAHALDMDSLPLLLPEACSSSAP